MSRSCRFSLFLHHNYQVSLRGHANSDYIRFVHYTQAGPDWQLASLAIAEKSSDVIFLKQKGSGNAIQSLNRKSYVDNMGLVIMQDNV